MAIVCVGAGVRVCVREGSGLDVADPPKDKVYEHLRSSKGRI